MLCHCLFARLSLSDVHSVSKLHNVHLLNLFIDVAKVVCTGQNDYAPVTRKNHVSTFFCKNISNFRFTTLMKESWYQTSGL